MRDNNDFYDTKKGFRSGYSGPSAEVLNPDDNPYKDYRPGQTDVLGGTGVLDERAFAQPAQEAPRETQIMQERPVAPQPSIQEQAVYDAQPYATPVSAAGISPFPKNKELKAFAKADIDWKRMLFITGGYIGISTLLSLVSTILASSGSVAAVMAGGLLSIIYLGLSAMMTAGLATSCLEQRRGEKISGLFGSPKKTLPMLGSSLLLALIFTGLLILPVGLIIAEFLISAGSLDGTLYLTEMSPVGWAGFILIIPAVVFMAIFSIIYSMTSFLIADGCGAVEALRSSRRMMKGYKGRYFLLMLTFIGWFILSLLFIALTSTGIGTLPLFFTGEASKVGAVLANINVYLIALICLAPVTAYMLMTQAEFYEALAGNTGRQSKETQKNSFLILIPLLASIVLSLFSAGSLLLPAARDTVPVTATALGISFTADRGILSVTAGENAGSNVTHDDPELRRINTSFVLDNTSWESSTEDAITFRTQNDREGMLYHEAESGTDYIAVYEGYEKDEAYKQALKALESLNISETQFASLFGGSKDDLIFIHGEIRQTEKNGKRTALSDVINAYYIGTYYGNDLTLLNMKSGATLYLTKAEGEETGTASGSSSGKQSLGAIAFYVPDSYIKGSMTDPDTVSFHDKEAHVISVTHHSYYSISYEKETYPDGTDEVVSGYSAYRYEYGEETVTYVIAIQVGEEAYTVSAGDKDVLDSVINTISIS